MTVIRRYPGELHATTRIHCSVAGFVVTDGRYPEFCEIGRHDHDLASLCIVLDGSYDEVFGRRTRHAVAGTIIAHPPGEHHADRHGPAPTRILTIEIGHDALNRLRPVMAFFDDARDRNDMSLTILGRRLAWEMQGEGAHDAPMIESMVLDILALAERSLLPDTRGARWVLRVRDYLEAHATERPSMATLSALAEMHPVHLARAFRRAFGCSVGTYIRQWQIAHALDLLQHPEHSLADIASQAGFSDQSHMTRLVGARTGRSPGAWRRDRG
jgi:AraC family transcriptional regulator